MKSILTIFYFLIACMLNTNTLLAQHLTEVSPSKPDTYLKAETMPEYPGGEEQLFKFISTNLKIPEDAIDAGTNGRIYASFIVDKTGKVRDVEIKRGLSPSLDAEAIRVIKSMPNWKPGTQDDQPVNVQMNIPIMIVIK